MFDNIKVEHEGLTIGINNLQGKVVYKDYNTDASG